MMSPKELMYIEDALGHEQQMKTACADASSKLEDKELSAFVCSLSERYEKAFKSFYSLLSC